MNDIYSLFFKYVFNFIQISKICRYFSRSSFIQISKIYKYLFRNLILYKYHCKFKVFSKKHFNKDIKDIYIHTFRKGFSSMMYMLFCYKLHHRFYDVVFLRTILTYIFLNSRKQHNFVILKLTLMYDVLYQTRQHHPPIKIYQYIIHCHLQ